MSSKIIIECFDINSNIKNNFKENIENPIRILDDFQETHLFLESEKIQVNPSEIKYKFVINFSAKDQMIFEIFVIKDLNFIHDITLISDANLIFINLENENTAEQLETIINYINESCCSMEINTYIIGIYKEKIIPILNKESIENLFEENKYNCEFHQIKYNKDDFKNHICMYEKDYDKKIININKNTILIENDINNDNLIDIMENILIKIYEDKMSVIYEPTKKKFKPKNSKYYKHNNNISQSGIDCNIF